MSTKTKTAAATGDARPEGRLEWRQLLRWLVEDEIIDAEQAQKTEQRFAAGDSSLHPLVRLGSAGLVRKSAGKPLEVEVLTEWLASRAKLPYMRIDPLKVDVGRVSDVMSGSYAEARRCLPIQFGLMDITIATSEPFAIGWVAQI